MALLADCEALSACFIALLAHNTTSNPTDLLSLFTNSQRQLIVPLPSSFWCRTVDMDNKWLVRCLSVKAFAADQPQAHVQVLWPPDKRQSTRVQIDSGMQEQAVLCAQNVTRLLVSALQHRLSKAACIRHDYTANIRRRLTTSGSTSFEHILARHPFHFNHVKEHNTLSRGAKNMSGSKRTKAHRRSTHERFM